MTHAAARIAAVLGTALFVTAPVSSAEGAKSPGSVIRCLPPGSANPVPCASTAAGSAILIDLRPHRSARPVTLFFEEVAQTRKRLVTRVAVPIEARAPDGSYRVILPRSMCTGRSGRTHFEVRQLVPALRMTESIALIAVDC